MLAYGTYAEPRSVRDWDGGWQSAFLGVGHLELAAGTTSDNYWTWAEYVALPLFDEPEGEFWGWIYEGQVAPAAATASSGLSGAGMTETDYERQTFIVLETSGDWLKIRHSAPGESGDGTAWTHACLLGLGEVSLVFERWEDVIMEDGGLPIFFRSDVAHSFRSGPSTDSERLGWITGDYEMWPVEFRGEWLRVRLLEPSHWCSGDDEFSGRKREGWIKWWGEDKGPWIYYPTRGC
ncbi:MAG: hypothetical protein ABFS14_02870 [Gemmatimonadota bacterium]